MSTWRHAALLPCPATAVSALLADLASSGAAAVLQVQHAAIVDHGSLGELDITIAGRGGLGAVIGQQAGTAVMLGPLLLIAAVHSGFAREVAVAEVSPSGLALRHVAEALPPRSGAVLLATGCGDSGRSQRVLRAATGVEPVVFGVSSRLEPWLASKVEVDLRVELPTHESVALVS